MLYAFEHLPSCDDPKALQGQYFSHNMTLEDCLIERRKFISGRIYFAATICNAFFIIATTILFIYCASTSKNSGLTSSDEFDSKSRLRLVWKRYSLQKKSVACTTLGAFGHLIFSSCIFAAQALNPTISCYLVLYGSLVGFYTWMFAYCTRAYRLRYLYQLNQFKFKYSRMSDEEKLLCLKNKQYRRYMAHSQKSPGNILRIPFLIYGISLIIILSITIPSQQYTVRAFNRCPTTWGAYVLLGMFGFFIAILTPLITYYLKDNSDAHGIKAELWAISLIGLPLFLLYAVFFFKVTPTHTNPELYMTRVFAPANWVIFFTAVAHLISVVLPLLAYFPIRIYKAKRIVKRHTVHKNNSIENFDIGGLEHRPISSLSIPLELTIECLERSLTDPYLMNQLQQHAIRDFSSENLLFYEKFLHLKEKIKEEYMLNHQLSNPTEQNCLVQPISENLLPECIELYEGFIRENATLQVNISYKARITLDQVFQSLYKQFPHLTPQKQKRPDRLYNATIPLWEKPTPCKDEDPTEDPRLSITLGLFETARIEVCWNIFNSVYPKLIEQEDH